MRLTVFKSTLLFVALFSLACGSGSKESEVRSPKSEVSDDATAELVEAQQTGGESIVLGVERTDLYFPLLRNKKVAVVANQTSEIIQGVHLIDSLVASEIAVVKVFAPEHGFRGKADAGESVNDGVDTKTGLPILSLHGSHKKPTAEQMKDLDIVVFDIQDVGVRFYTYISTMHYVMEACAEAKIPFVVLDRPNPNGHYVDGPTMKKGHTSFLGLHEVPLVHGMTVGEYARMINGQKWLSDGLVCDLTVIEMKNYTHETFYSVPVRPSPNLPNDIAINLYPSLGLLEGTTLNAGRGTEMQFQIFGSPDLPKENYPFSYTPQPNFGAKYPKHEGTLCNGLDLRETPRMSRVDLSWIIEAYKSSNNKADFFNTKNFTAHAGTAELQQQIEQGYTFREIRKTWMKDLAAFKELREKYLIY
ncbi:MAG: DUF1343 domain-containing protein [Flavobacteriaceae bacterium]|nr:DUF1343 domain-containing protein [Flavobacteriaceae bacterium]